MFWSSVLFSVVGILLAILCGTAFGEKRKEGRIDALGLYFLLGAIFAFFLATASSWMGGEDFAAGKPDTRIKSGRVNMVYQVIQVSEIEGKTYASLRDPSDHSWRIYEMKSRPSGQFVKLVEEDGKKFFQDWLPASTKTEE